MLTEFGKFIRKRRIDKMITLRQMADDMGVSPSYLSSVETGKRNIKPSLLASIVAYFGLSASEVTEMERFAEVSQNNLTLSLRDSNLKQRSSAVVFARTLNELSDDDLRKINRILESK